MGLLLAAAPLAEAQQTKPPSTPRATKRKPTATPPPPAASVPAIIEPAPTATVQPLVPEPANAKAGDDLRPPLVEHVDLARSYLIGAGDVVRVGVFQQPDMAVEARVSEVGTVTVPLVGLVEVGGLTARQAEAQIAYLLRRGGFVRDPQVNVNVIQFKAKPVSVLGNVNRPGRYYLEEGVYRVTDLLSLAGGVAPGASDVAILMRTRDGKEQRYEVDVPSLFQGAQSSTNVEVVGGDTIYVDRAPLFYVYGEVQRPGAFRLEKDMILMQALSVGGGLTLRGSRKDIQITRKDPKGNRSTFAGQLGDVIQADDVIYVKESLF